MIEGLQLLPRLRAMRESQMDQDIPDPYAEAYGNCNACLYGYKKPNGAWEPPFDRTTRRAWGCGYLPEDERLGCELNPAGGPDPTVCPGYTTTLPEVQEASIALGWRKDGALREWLGERELTPALAQAIDVLAVAVKETESEVIRRKREEAKNGSR